MANGKGNIELQLRIQADLSAAQAALNGLRSSLGGVNANTRTLGQAGNAAAAGLNNLDRSASSSSRSLNQTGRSVDGVTAQLIKLKNIAGAVTGLTLGAGIVRSLASVSDEYSMLNARIRLVSSSNAQAATTFSSVSRLASETGQRVAATAELYTRMARSLKSGGASQTELLRVTETINKAAIVSGATSQEASAAIIQLSQGLASGALRGEEFNSVSEQMPRIMDMLMASLGKTRGELRKMANDGKLTTEVVFRALKEGAAEIDKEFAQMPATIGTAVTQMANAWMGFVGGTNDALGVSKAIAAVISGLAQNLSALTTAALALAVVMSGKKVAAFVSATQATRAARVETTQLARAEYLEAKAAVSAAQAQMARARSAGILNPVARAKAEDALTAALHRQTAAEAALMATRQKSAMSRLGSGLMGFMGGPVGVAITGVAIAVAGLTAAYSSAQERERELEQQHRQTIQTLEDQRQKTLALVDAQGKLKGSVSTSDALTQQKGNTDVLEQDSKKLQQLQQQASTLKTQIEHLMDSPNESGFGMMVAERKLADINKQIEALTPKFESLAVAQDVLSTGLDQRLARALDAVNKQGKTLSQTLDAMFENGPVKGTNWSNELASAMATNEATAASLTDEAEKLRKKLEKELTDATYTAAQQLAMLRDNIIAAAIAAGQAPEDIDKLRASMESLINLQKSVDTAKENKRRADAAARSARSSANANENYVKSLEKQAAMMGKTQSQVRAYELAEKGLSGALKARAEAAMTVINAEDQKQQADANAVRNLQLQIEYMKQLGDVEGAGLLEVQGQMAALRKEFEKSGNTEGLNWIDKLLPLQETKVRVDAIKKQMDDLATYRSQQETSIQAQVQGGLLSELEGRRQLIDLHKEVGSKITETLPQLKEMANLPGQAGENIRELISSLEGEMLRLKDTTDSLSDAFTNGLQNGIESSLNSLADGTLNLSDALLNLARTVVNSMAQMASRNLGEMAMQGLSSVGGQLSGLFGSAAPAAAGAATSAATETATATAAATTYATAITTASTTGAAAMGTTLATGGTALSTGFMTAITTGVTALTAALTTAFTTGAATLATAIASATAGSGAASGAAAAVSVAAATGGLIRGPGTSTSDSIPSNLSNGEYVIQAAAVRRYGVDYLHALNNGRLRGFSEGGLVSSPTPRNTTGINESAEKLRQSGENGPTGYAPTIQQTLVLDSAEAFSSGINTIGGKRSMLTFIRANAPTLRQELGIKG
ncbi:tape measure protein [Budviciaceae bacterium CWB-B4]|uniref:Tape measure protein n=1 Tax=Limnobaculum xujianqingii TaxID=2738837 RepID=A0A9D7AGW8_9GAMM|nr:tape measure protein [Limnobaculum xujianqingii]MBK5072577.1 tape measure protein [Limnobaculum xujianqingii]MBK5175886.1 tape measure protein [Limnobaculum xujianqingii]